MKFDIVRERHALWLLPALCCFTSMPLASGDVLAHRFHRHVNGPVCPQVSSPTIFTVRFDEIETGYRSALAEAIRVLSSDDLDRKVSLFRYFEEAGDVAQAAVDKAVVREWLSLLRELFGRVERVEPIGKSTATLVVSRLMWKMEGRTFRCGTDVAA